MSLSCNLACWLLASLPCDAVVHNVDWGQEGQEAVQRFPKFLAYAYKRVENANVLKMQVNAKYARRWPKYTGQKLLFTLHLQSGRVELESHDLRDLLGPYHQCPTYLVIVCYIPFVIMSKPAQNRLSPISAIVAIFLLPSCFLLAHHQNHVTTKKLLHRT